MSDQSTKDLLKKLGLERLIAKFERHELTKNDFRYLLENKNELKEVLPVLRDRIDFVESTRNIRAVTVEDVGIQVGLDTVLTTKVRFF